ncbi:class Ib ribonucleoside-diphosphate reductase assembly flavoprotein NrdI [Erysipelothrix rhusiopathiae]|nr:class Ib ribonucleoside-diphosphate reductase assembly flavoprotein NrdI [Erysipelothrix rhusiopathiae]MDE8100088.1 class Ib ribonucleoside-diphosphate reductase assembly flavoprotein NrdI [Erysipelothrix rhusiopathiae]MDE8108519.1 class Ib ribonucleoside-diphosphate reductase assembly flavoprotein NrdI [Erysipelothrix rhusiopathiae]
MIVVFDSLTGQCQRFAEKLGVPCIDILDYEPIDEDIFLVTRSWDFGKVTEETKVFLEHEAAKVIGLAVGGNRNWGTNFGAAGDKIHHEYNIELVLKFEGSGFTKDVELVQTWIESSKGRTNK